MWVPGTWRNGWCEKPGACRTSSARWYRFRWSSGRGITERIEDMFIVGGFNRPTTEIERLFAAHPLIGPAARVGVRAPDKMLAHASVFTLSRYAG
ncbi:hypothetical protein DF020_02095 [Burkholderia cenocepacia]|nr:hypothetical protein DF020_02095 [Burkholderia cenocepacia]